MKSICDWIDHWSGASPGETAIQFEDRAISYAEFAHRTSTLAWVLQRRLGIRRGDRVAHLAQNTPDCLALIFACARIGAIFAPLNYRLAAPEIEALLEDAKASVLFADAVCAETLLSDGCAHCPVVCLEAAAGRPSMPALRNLENDALPCNETPPSAQVKVIDDDGRTLPAFPLGELLLRGPNIMLGYWQNAGATRSSSTLDEQAVLDLFSGRVGRYKRPKHVLFLAELPRNALGKGIRSEVRGLATARLAG